MHVASFAATIATHHNLFCGTSLNCVSYARRHAGVRGGLPQFHVFNSFASNFHTLLWTDVGPLYAPMQKKVQKKVLLLLLLSLLL